MKPFSANMADKNVILEVHLSENIASTEARVYLSEDLSQEVAETNTKGVGDSRGALAGG